MEKPVLIQAVAYSDLFIDTDSQPKVNFSIFLGKDQEPILNEQITFDSLLSNFISTAAQDPDCNKQQIIQALNRIEAIIKTKKNLL